MTLSRSIHVASNGIVSFFYGWVIFHCIYILHLLITIDSTSQLLTIPYLGNIRLFLREGNGTPLQYSCLENPMDGGAWCAAVHGVTRSRTRLSDFTFTFHFHALEKEMATHSSVLAWRTPGTGEPGGLPSKGSHRVGHDWRDLAGYFWLCIIANTFVLLYS